MRKAVVLALAALLLAPTAAQAVRRPYSFESFRKVEGATRDYWLYTPEGRVQKGGRPLVVYLHGCTQNNDTDPQVAFGTRWNELAARVGAVVLYPLQSEFDMEHPEALEGNGGTCWNWFLDQNMHRGAGEPKLLADLTSQVVASEHVNPSRVYVMGTSAGADMTNVLSVTYPDVFKAAAMFAGCAYDACADTTGTLASRELAAHGLRPVPAIIFQGGADTLNVLAMGETLLHQQVGMHRAARRPSSTEQHGDPTAADPGGGNPCVDHTGYPCAAGATGWPSYPYTVDHYGGGVVDFWTIHGLNHDYPYGDTRSTFTDPAGPDITRAAWDFFATTA